MNREPANVRAAPPLRSVTRTTRRPGQHAGNAVLGHAHGHGTARVLAPGPAESLDPVAVDLHDPVAAAARRRARARRSARSRPRSVMSCTAAPPPDRTPAEPASRTAVTSLTWRSVHTSWADRWFSAASLIAAKSALNSTSATPWSDTGTDGRNAFNGGTYVRTAAAVGPAGPLREAGDEARGQLVADQDVDGIGHEALAGPVEVVDVERPEVVVEELAADQEPGLRVGDAPLAVDPLEPVGDGRRAGPARVVALPIEPGVLDEPGHRRRPGCGPCRSSRRPHLRRASGRRARPTSRPAPRRTGSTPWPPQG